MAVKKNDADTVKGGEATTATDASTTSTNEIVSPPANLEPATEFEPSGAPVQIVPDVDPAHPAVDADPRAGTTVLQNQIDFNDPTLSGADAVAKNLEAQSKD